MPRKRVEFCWLKVARSDGSWFSVSPILTLPLLVSSPAERLVTGTFDVSLSACGMRDPVTTINSSPVSAAAVVAAICSGVAPVC